jgi:hypothetical protein
MRISSSSCYVSCFRSKYSPECPVFEQPSSTFSIIVRDEGLCLYRTAACNSCNLSLWAELLISAPLDHYKNCIQPTKYKQIFRVIGTINRVYFSKHNSLALVMDGGCVFALYKINFGTFYTYASGFKGLKRKDNLFYLLSLTAFRCHRPKQSNSFCPKRRWRFKNEYTCSWTTVTVKIPYRWGYDSYDSCHICLLSKTQNVLLPNGHKKIYRPQEIVSLCPQV